MMTAVVTKLRPENWVIHKDQQCMDSDRLATDYGFKGNNTNSQAPATVSLALGFQCSGKFETA